MLLAMNLSGAIIYYVGSFIVMIGCAVGGVFLGKALRKRKDAKTSQEKKAIE